MIHFLRIYFIAFALIFSSHTAYTQDSDIAVAYSGNMVGDEASTRFFLNLDKNISVQAFYMDSPNRIVIDMDETRFSISNDEALVPTGLITNVQMGRIGKGRSRIVLTLKQPAEIIKASISSLDESGNHRFLLDIDSTDSIRFTRLLNAQRRIIGDSGGVASKGDRLKPQEKVSGRFTIVLDPGHGGIDGGAVGKNGTSEKDIVFKFAKLLRNKLEKIGPFDIKMTREDDVFLSLRQRLDFNRRAKADLFISIHADSLKQTYVRGSTIYTLSKKASDRLSEDLANSENSVDLIAGLSIPKEDTEAVTDILADLTATETKKFSRRFSTLLVKELGPKVKLIKNPQRSAAFGVLKAPDVPSVLIELGYLSNTEDERLLNDQGWREKATEAVANSVNTFFEVRQ